MAKDSDEAADRPWNGDKAGWVEAEKLLDRKIYDQLGDPGQWYWREAEISPRHRRLECQ